MIRGLLRNKDLMREILPRTVKYFAATIDEDRDRRDRDDEVKRISKQFI